MYVQTIYANLEKQATTLICMLRNKLEKQATPREAGQILSWRAGVTALRDGAPCCFVLIEPTPMLYERTKRAPRCCASRRSTPFCLFLKIRCARGPASASTR